MNPGKLISIAMAVAGWFLAVQTAQAQERYTPDEFG